MRNYRKEYDNYQGSTIQKQRRAARNKARRQALAKGSVKKGDNTDIHHLDGNPKNNRASNLQIRSKSHNRSFPRNKKAGKI